MKLITITGIDKSGKSTLIDAVHKETAFEHYILDRDPSTYLFFNDLRGRVKDDAQDRRYHYFMNKFRPVIDLAVFLRADVADIKVRFALCDEPNLVGDLNFKDHQDRIEEYFDNEHYRNYLKLNTTDLCVEDCVDKILGALHAC